ncbi:MAG: TatD family hydrolase [Puniceicoccales bacterium]
MSDADAEIFDAHCHWHDARLIPHAEQIERDLQTAKLRYTVVNGTHPGDWDAVAALAEQDERVIPAFGLHPWKVNDAPADWLEKLQSMLDRFPNAVIGEVGLDRWIEGHDLPRQEDALKAQLELAAAENRPISLHCLKAWGQMLQLLETVPLPARGFHLHGYGGSPEMVRAFAELGGYFSFSAYVMHSRKVKHRDSLRVVPEDRLLIETDSPDMLPPEEWQVFALPGKAAFAHALGGELLHHPANITAGYRAVAEVKEVDELALRRQVEANFMRYFLQ